MVSNERPMTQAEIEEGCASARDRYLALPRKVAREFFALELQGFVAAEVELGNSFSYTVATVVDLLGLLIRANLKNEPPGRG